MERRNYQGIYAGEGLLSRRESFQFVGIAVLAFCLFRFAQGESLHFLEPELPLMALTGQL